MDKENIKTTDWLTRGMTKEQIAREKQEAVMAADLELCYTERMGVSKLYPDYDAIAERMYEIGYRKQSAIIDEFVERLKDTSITKWDYHEAVDVDEIDRVAAIMKGDMN